MSNASELFAKYVEAGTNAAKENLTVTDGKLSSNNEGTRAAYVKGLPEWANEEKVVELALYDKGFNEGYNVEGVGIMAGYLKEHEDVDSLSLGFESPLGGQYIDFARPQGDEVTNEDRVNSFQPRRSIEGGEDLMSKLRTRLGSFYE